VTPNSETVGDALVALVRTVVPLTAGHLLALAAQAGMTVDPSTAELVTFILTAAFTAIYYTGVRLLSVRWAWFGWLLGYPTNPTYIPPSDDTVAEITAKLIANDPAIAEAARAAIRELDR